MLDGSSTYTLVGAPASYFTGKARGYLRWKGVSFRELVATPEVYRDVIEPRVGFSIIPVLLTPDDATVQDTSDIIDHVEAAEAGAPEVYPPGAVQKLAALLFELYGDEWLVIPAMHYRWHYNEEWIVEELGRTASPEASAEEQRRIGRVVGERFRGFVPRLGVSEETISGIEAHYEGFLADFSAHLRLHPFLLGSRPSIGDFGLLGPLYAHLLRDPASGERMRRLAPLVADWVTRCHEPAPLAGDFLPDDDVPATLGPMLKRQAAEQAPVLLDAARALAAWASVQPTGARVPRSLGEHEFNIGGRRGERAILTYSLWMLQRALDHLKSLTGAERARADAFLEDIGAAALIDFRMPRRLERRDFRLVIV
jgi:glutathione S-transferase